MIKSNKITHGDIDFKSKSAELKSYRMDKIMSPYDGLVVKTNNNNCKSGYLLIQHNIDGSKFYSQFCGVDNPLVHLSDDVRGGATLGFFSDDPITYSVLSANLEYINPKSFLNGELFKNEKSPEKEKTKEKTKSYEQDKDSEEYQLNALAPVTIPLEFVTKQITKGAGKVGKELKKIGKGMFNFKDKEKDDRLKKAREDKDNDDNNQSLNENIQRIKKLLK
jgi:hypothetical protein